MKFRATLPRESHPLMLSVVKRFETIDNGSASRGKRRAVIMLSPKGLSMVRHVCSRRMDTVRAQAVIAATDDVLAFAELSADFFGDFRVQSQAEDCILINLALTHLCARPLPSSERTHIAPTRLAS